MQEIDSAEKPSLSENSGHQKMINQAPIVRHTESVSEIFFLIFGERLFQQNRNQSTTPNPDTEVLLLAISGVRTASPLLE